MNPHIRTGQGASEKSVWLDGGYWHEPHMPPDNNRTIRVWLRGEDQYRLGFYTHVRGAWVFYDDDDIPTHTDNIIGWQDIPAQAEPQPAPSHDWPLMLGVAAVVVTTLVLALYAPGAGLALAAGFGAGVVLAQR